MCVGGGVVDVGCGCLIMCVGGVVVGGWVL